MPFNFYFLIRKPTRTNRKNILLSVNVVKLKTTRTFTPRDNKNFLASFYYFAINFFCPVSLSVPSNSFSQEKNRTKRISSQARNWIETEQNYVKFFRWEKSSENDDRFSRMMRVCSAAQGRNGKVVSNHRERRRAKNSSQQNGKLGRGKMLCMSWGIFFFKIKLLWHFFTTKSFSFSIHFSRSRILSRGSADDSINWTRAPLDTNSTVHSHCFSFLSVSLTATHNFTFLSVDFLAELLHKPKNISSNAIKTLAKHFSWNEAVKKFFFSVSIFSAQAFFVRW